MPSGSPSSLSAAPALHERTRVVVRKGAGGGGTRDRLSALRVKTAGGRREPAALLRPWTMGNRMGRT